MRGSLRPTFGQNRPPRRRLGANVESHYVDSTTLCGILPPQVDEFSAPNIPAIPSSFLTGTLGDFACTERLAKLNF